MKPETIDKILQETEVGYELVAEKFSATRNHFWPELEFIQDYAKDGDRLLDFGCGNGRLLELFQGKDVEYFGVDISQKLLEIAKNKHASERTNFQKINPGQYTLAFPDNFFNAAYAVAVFHHFPKQHAQRMAAELYRVVRPGGKVIVTVWNLWQRAYAPAILGNWWNKLFAKSDLDWNDCYISFKNNQGEIFQRYHHAWTKRELRKVFAAAGWQAELSAVNEGKNIFLVAKKLLSSAQQ